MRLQAAAGRPDAVRRTLSLLETRLTELGITPGTQTRHVAAALLGTPSPPPPPSSPARHEHRAAGGARQAASRIRAPPLLTARAAASHPSPGAAHVNSNARP